MKHFHRPLSSHPPSFITANDVTGYNSNNKLCGKRPQYAPAPVTFDLLTLKVVSESRVTRATSVPILVFLVLSVLDVDPMYATDVRQHHCLIPA